MPQDIDNPAKQYINQKLIDFQKKIADVTFTLNSLQSERDTRERELFLEIIEVLDAFENVSHTLDGKGPIEDKSAQRAVKSFQAIQKKIMRLLSRRDIEQIQFPKDKAVFGLCKVVDTKTAPEMENETILSIVRKGYKRKAGEVIRPAEVITVLNRE